VRTIRYCLGVPPEGFAPVFEGVVSRREARLVFGLVVMALVAVTDHLRRRDVLLRATEEEPETPPALVEAATGPDA
jgi:hypothetical protein